MRAEKAASLGRVLKVSEVHHPGPCGRGRQPGQTSDSLSSEAPGALGIRRAYPQSAPQRQKQGSFTSLVLLSL